MHSPEAGDEDARMYRTYILVLITEFLVITALWLFERAFS